MKFVILLIILIYFSFAIAQIWTKRKDLNLNLIIQPIGTLFAMLIGYMSFLTTDVSPNLIVKDTCTEKGIRLTVENIGDEYAEIEKINIYFENDSLTMFEDPYLNGRRGSQVNSWKTYSWIDLGKILNGESIVFDIELMYNDFTFKKSPNNIDFKIYYISPSHKSEVVQYLSKCY